MCILAAVSKPANRGSDIVLFKRLREGLTPPFFFFLREWANLPVCEVLTVSAEGSAAAACTTLWFVEGDTA